jgi:hypothetical protein
MAAVEPARERIQRRLQDAVERLRHDMDEVEFWTEVLSGLTRPVPDYSGTSVLNRFALPQRGSDDPARLEDWDSDRHGEKAKFRRPDGQSNTGNSRH